MSDLQVVYVPISEINAAKYNPRGITDDALDALKASLVNFGFVDPVIVNRRTNTLVGGHQRLKAAADLGHKTVPVVYVDLDEAKEKALNITLNSEKVSGYFDPNLLQALIDDIKVDMPDLIEDLRFDDLLAGYKFDLDLSEENADDEDNESKAGNLVSKFGIAPFSVFNAREGWWQNRKRAWIALGIKSELGRGGG